MPKKNLTPTTQMSLPQGGEGSKINSPLAPLGERGRGVPATYRRQILRWTPYLALFLNSPWGHDLDSARKLNQILPVPELDSILSELKASRRGKDGLPAFRDSVLVRRLSLLFSSTSW